MCSDPLGLDSPNEGDLSVCIACGGYLQFEKDLSVKKADPAMLFQFLMQQPDDYEKLAAMSNAAKQVQSESEGDRSD